MSYKAAIKRRPKAPPGSVNTITEKLVGKPFHFGVGKTKALYGLHKSAAGEIRDFSHDAGVVSASDPLDEATQSTPEERENELAGELVADVEKTSPDVAALCKTYGLRREELGRLTGFSLRALAEWSAGKLPSQPAARRLREVRRLLDALSEIVKRESIPKWLHQPNPAFAPLTPLQVIELGEIDRLWEMVHDLASGQPT